MTTKEVAEKLVELCRAGDFETVYKELYSQDIVSIEPEGGTWETVQGMEAIAKKGEQWHAMVEEFHSSEVSDPIVAGDFFSCTMKTELSLKGVSHRINMDEVCVYRVDNGKVVTEQFFYTPMPEFAN